MFCRETKLLVCLLGAGDNIWLEDPWEFPSIHRKINEPRPSPQSPSAIGQVTSFLMTQSPANLAPVGEGRWEEVTTGWPMRWLWAICSSLLPQPPCYPNPPALECMFCPPPSYNRSWFQGHSLDSTVPLTPSGLNLASASIQTLKILVGGGEDLFNFQDKLYM